MTRKYYSHPGKELKSHLENVRDIGLRVFSEKGPLNFSFPPGDLELSLSYILYYHDIGKSSDYFQEYLNCQANGREYREKHELKNHALISAAYASYRAYQDLTGQGREILPLVIFLCIYKHHGNFSDLRNMAVITGKEFCLLEQQWDKLHPECIAEPPAFLFADLKDYLYDLDEKVEIIENHLEYYFLVNFFFSILTYADKSDAIFDREMKTTSWARDWSLLVDNYKKKKFRNDQPSSINGIREEIYRLCAGNITRSMKHHSIFAINVPTGSGKTLAVVNTAIKLLEQDPTLKRIIYAFPFTSIIDQAAEIMKEVFAVNNLDHEDFLLVHHHLSEARIKIDEEIFSGDKGQFIIENWEKPFILTTFWQLFNTIISNENQLLRRFHHLADSIIILDEIQSFPYEYWKLINQVLKELTRLLNCKIIFLTATMPMIFSAAEGEIMDFIDRDNKTRYFKSFSRYSLSLVKDLSNITVEELFAEVQGEIAAKKDKSFLFVFNTIKSSKDFYHLVNQVFPGENPIYLSTNILPAERKKRIALVKDVSRRRIVISTQLIEAGVDIDLDIVYRDFSPLDSIVQSAGRCNRNSRKKTGEVCLFSLKKEGSSKKDSNYIYPHHSLLPTEKLFMQTKSFSESDLLSAVEQYYQHVKDTISTAPSDVLLENIGTLEYEEIKKNFQLIKYIPSELVFIEKDDKAANILKKFQEIWELPDRLQRRNEFLTIKKDFYEYTLSVRITSGNSGPSSFPELGHLSIIPRHLVKEYYDENTGYKEPGQVIF